jgi:hypothetical protein
VVVHHAVRGARPDVRAREDLLVLERRRGDLSVPGLGEHVLERAHDGAELAHLVREDVPGA